MSGYAPGMTSLHIDPGIRCLLAPNPSPMTFRGTNTYILGQGDVAVLDPGPDDPAHLAAILAATTGERITHILVSHDHHDHVSLVPALQRATGAPTFGHGSPASGFVPDVLLADGAVLEGPDWRIEAIHTPGHSDDHLCFGFGDVCLTADHVMGWASTAIIPPRGCLLDYMRSLSKLEARPWRRFLSAHGDPMDDPARRITTLRDHRRAREASILAHLSDRPQTLDELVDAIYRKLAPGLMRAARHNVHAHLIALNTTGRLTREGEVWGLAGQA